MNDQPKKSRLLLLALCTGAALIAGCTTQQIGSLGMTGFTPTSADDAPSESSTHTLYLTIVEGLLAQGRYRAALGYLNQYAVSESANPRFNMLRGEALLGVQQYDEAQKSFATLIDTDLSGVGYSGLGRVEAANGNWDAAQKNFTKAVAARPSDADYLNNLGYAEIQLDKEKSVAKALFNLRQAQELDPKSASIRNNLILALTLSGEEEEAQRVLQSISTPSERIAVRKFVTNWTQSKSEKEKE